MELEHGHHDGHHHHGPKSLPAVLAAPDFLAAWRMRALVIAAVFALISVIFAFTDHQGPAHLLRSYLMGSMTVFNFVGGALAWLLVQYLSGGKWGLILRRPLEAMTRTWWLVAILFLPILFLMKKLYLWAAYHTPEQTLSALHQGLIDKEQQVCINLKHTMLSPTSAVVEYILVFGFMGCVITLLNKWSVSRDADPGAGTVRSFDRWRILF